MTTQVIINEGSTCYIAASFIDPAGAELAPSSISYQINDEDSGDVLQGPTSVDPASSIEIRVPPAINALHDASRSSEIRVVTIEAVYGTDSDVIVDEVRWVIRNLRFKA